MINISTIIDLSESHPLIHSTIKSIKLISKLKAKEGPKDLPQINLDHQEAMIQGHHLELTDHLKVIPLLTEETLIQLLKVDLVNLMRQQFLL